MEGIDIQFLDGIESQTSTMKDIVLSGYNDNVAGNFNLISEGLDLAGMIGNASIEDEEKMHAYLTRTYNSAKQYPQSLIGYQNPNQFIQMLGYVLGNWDTENREQAIEEMAKAEERLIGLGKININFSEDEMEAVPANSVEGTDDDYIQMGKVAVLKNNKKGFFNQLKRGLYPRLNRTAREIVANNPLLDKFHESIRKSVAKNRKNRVLKVADKKGNIRKINQKVAIRKESLKGVEDDILDSINGADLENLNTTGSVYNDSQLLKGYYKNIAKQMVGNPSQFFEDEEERKEVLGQIDYLLANWENEPARNKVLGQLSGENMSEDEYEDFVEGLGEIRNRNELKGFFDTIKKFVKKLRNKKGVSKLDVKRLNKKNPFIAKRLNGFGDTETMTADEARNFNYHSLVNGFGNTETMTADEARNFDYNALLNGVDFQVEGLSGVGAVNATRNYLKRTKKAISQNPEMYFNDIDEYEDAVGMLNYAISNIDNESAMERLCGIGMTDEQYDDMQLTLGALGAKKTKAEKKAQKQAKKAAKKQAKAQKKAEKAKQKAVKKAEKAKKKAEKKAVKAQKKAERKEKRKKYWKKVKENTKKIGQKIKKFFKKVIKFIIKYNPISLLIRGGLLLCLSLNLFSLAVKTYPGSITKEQYAKETGLTITDDEYAKLKKGYDKLKSVYTKLGGTEKVLLKYLNKGKNRKWAGGDKFNKSELKTAMERNKGNLDTLVSTEENALKKAGATSTNDPNVTFSVKKDVKEVEVAEEAVNGLIENCYLNGLYGVNGALGEIAIAASVASAGTVIATIIGFLSKLGIKPETLQKIKDAFKKKGDGTNLLTRIKNVFKKDKTGTESTAKTKEEKKADLKAGWDNFKQKAGTLIKNVGTNIINKYTNPQTKEAVEEIAETAEPMNINYSAMQNFESGNDIARKEQKKSSTSKILLIGGGALAVGIGAYVLMKKNKKQQ